MPTLAAPRPTSNPIQQQPIDATRNGDADRKEEIVASLKAFKQRTGRFPTSRDCDASRSNDVCDRNLIRRHFNSFREAFAAAFPAESNGHVILQGEVCLYEAKAPYEKSGQSIRGAIEYDLSAESMKCHECGLFFRDLGYHIRRHSITGKAYKIKHGLRSSSALVNDSKRIALSDASRRVAGMTDAEGASHKMHLMRLLVIRAPRTAEQQTRSAESREAGKAERRNVDGGCSAQCLEKIRVLADTLGRTPCVDEFKANGISPWYVRYHFGSTNRAMELAGLQPRAQGAARTGDARTPPMRTKKPVPEEFLIRQLRVFFYNHKRIPRSSDLRRGFFTANYYRFRQHWGSWRAAVEVAFSPREIAADGFWAKKCAKPYRHPAELPSAKYSGAR